MSSIPTRAPSRREGIRTLNETYFEYVMYASSITRLYVTDESRTRILLDFGADPKSAVYTISTTITHYSVRLSLATEAIRVVTTYLFPLNYFIICFNCIILDIYDAIESFSTDSNRDYYCLQGSCHTIRREKHVMDRQGLEPQT